MTRPAVIIGLGGTGQWVTTCVKRELLEDNGGHAAQYTFALFRYLGGCQRR